MRTSMVICARRPNHLGQHPPRGVQRLEAQADRIAARPGETGGRIPLAARQSAGLSARFDPTQEAAVVGVEESYRTCQQATRRTSSSFYYSFFMLPREKRRAMYALYAFLRHTDDLSDGNEPTEVKRRLLVDWREALHAALRGEYRHAILPAVADTLS